MTRMVPSSLTTSLRPRSPLRSPVDSGPGPPPAAGPGPRATRRESDLKSPAKSQWPDRIRPPGPGCAQCQQRDSARAGGGSDGGPGTAAARGDFGQHRIDQASSRERTLTRPHAQPPRLRLGRGSRRLGGTRELPGPAEGGTRTGRPRNAGRRRGFAASSLGRFFRVASLVGLAAPQCVPVRLGHGFLVRASLRADAIVHETIVQKFNCCNCSRATNRFMNRRKLRCRCDSVRRTGR